MNITIIEQGRLTEADDIIGQAFHLAVRERNFDVLILTGDRDSFQLISDRVKVILPSTKSGRKKRMYMIKRAILENTGFFRATPLLM